MKGDTNLTTITTAKSPLEGKQENKVGKLLVLANKKIGNP